MKNKLEIANDLLLAAGTCDDRHCPLSFVTHIHTAHIRMFMAEGHEVVVGNVVCWNFMCLFNGFNLTSGKLAKRQKVIIINPNLEF
jgi:hypothetical protein